MRIPILTLYLLVCICVLSRAQNITPAQQKTLNDCIAYGNQSGNEVAAVVESLKDYYLKIHQKNYGYGIRYTCPIQLDDYYYNTTTASVKSLGVLSTTLGSKLKDLRTAAEKIDVSCKALDTYHKLEDYKQDHFAKAETIILDIQVQVKDYAVKQQLLSDELMKVFSKLHKYTEANAYYKTDIAFRKQLDRERAYLNTWTFNLAENIHSGWSVENLEQTIAETDKQCKALAAFNPSLKYPSSSMVGSFREALGSVLETKRNALDGYNSEARKSDRHSNDAYMNLINYYDGALLADYNTYIGFATGDGYYGIGAIRYVPQFEIRTQEEAAATAVKAFQDIPHTELSAVAQKTAIPKATFNTLNLYLDFINDGLGQMDYLNSTLRNLNSSAAYYRGLTTFKGKGGLTYSYDKFEVPLSLYQQLVTESAAIPASYRKSLNDQAGVLLSILKEMNQWGVVLEVETKEKRYEKDKLARIFEALDRYKVLMETFDKEKEQLYLDVRKIYESYPPANAASSWSVSGKALQKLVDLDHDALFIAREHYKGTAPVTSISTTSIDETLRNVISNEYTNMKGIEKLGSYNGNCPYTPYEDIPASSKVFSGKLTRLEPVTPSSSYGYEHPYHEMVYQYNDIVDDLNKFSELSKTIFLLKSVNQPELFIVVYSDKEEDDDEAKQETAKPPTLPQKDPDKIQEKKTEPRVEIVKAESGANRNENTTVDRTGIYHDTVYIEKRDTIYITDNDENLHSMEGYATNNMVLLLDVSGSMNAPEKLPLLKTSVLDLLKMMRPEDEVSIITYSGKASVLLKPTSFKNEEQIKQVIEKLKSEGKTDGNAGLKTAYKVADENYIRGGNNRIILATDGEFPISEESFAMVEKFSKEDIFISVFNFGKTNASGKNLEKLGKTGRGNYEYITRSNVELKLIREVKAKKKK